VTRAACRDDTDAVDLPAKLQIKSGTSVAVVRPRPDGPDLSGLGPLAAEPGTAGAVIAFVIRADELTAAACAAIAAAREDRLAWIAYPKAGQLGTDINRDRLAAAVAELGVRPVRQVALDDVWSALRFRPA
jgi:hypothetical protein